MNTIGYFSRLILGNVDSDLFIYQSIFKFASDISSGVSTCCMNNRIYDGIKEITNRFHFAFRARDTGVTRHGRSFSSNSIWTKIQTVSGCRGRRIRRMYATSDTPFRVETFSHRSSRKKTSMLTFRFP